MAAKQAQPQTLITDGHAICQLYGHAGVPLAAVTREHVTGYLVALRAAGRSSSTIDTYYRAIRRFYNWAERAEIAGRSPCAFIERPQVASKLTRVLPAGELSALIKACKGKDARSRRDEAVVRILAEFGLRASELCGVQLDHIDIYNDYILVKEGKWARERLVPFGNDTGSAITAMLRTRPAAAGPYALVGDRAPYRPVTRSGLAQILEYRCALAGLPRVNPHQLRHTAVYQVRGRRHQARRKDDLRMGR